MVLKKYQTCIALDLFFYKTIKTPSKNLRQTHRKDGPQDLNKMKKNIHQNKTNIMLKNSISFKKIK